jgi:hypothetical protein
VLPSGVWEAERLTRMFTGNPVRATAVEVNCQLPTMVFTIPGRLKKGLPSPVRHIREPVEAYLGQALSR